MEQGKTLGDRAGLLITISVIALLVAIVMFSMNLNIAAEHDATMKSLAAEKAEAQAAVETERESGAVSAEVQAQHLASAQEAGEKLAELQNEDIGNTSYDFDRMKELGDERAAMFAEKDKSSARTAWPPNVIVGSKWVFLTTITSSAKTIPCVWVCKQTDIADDRILGYVLADYDVETGLFSNLEKHVTAYGVQVSEATPASSTSSTQSEPSSTATESASSESASASSASAGSQSASSERSGL